MPEAENKAAFRRLYEVVWNEGDLSVVDDLVAEDFVNHVVETRTAHPDWASIGAWGVRRVGQSVA